MTLLEDILRHPDVTKPPDRAGQAWAWCPWHNDKGGTKPNLSINTQKNGGKGMAHCFVCDNGGLRKLADAWGLTTAGKNSKLDITKVYDYRDEAGASLYEVVRALDENGDKAFRQRRRDPSEPSGYKWSLGRTRRVPYMLPELIAPGADEQVLIVEGEKDVENLIANGFLATTNSEGVGKWRPEWGPLFERRYIVIIPDNDPAGHKHAEAIASMLQESAYSIKIIHLPDLPPKGDVTDWLEQGHNRDELLELIDVTPLHKPAAQSETPSIAMVWEGNKFRPVALQIIQRLKNHGSFVRSVDGRNYFFDRNTKKLGEVSAKENSFEVVLILNRTYQINKTEGLYGYLSAELEVEAAVNGNLATPRQFAHYDAPTNCIYLDMFDGNVVKLDGQDISLQDNGQDGVLFATVPRASPWAYKPTNEDLLQKIIIDSINFDNETSPYTLEDQRLLMLSWILSIAFESVQPTKPLALAVGPGGSGKSFLFRRIGKMFFGPEYQVDALQKDKEENFWTKVTGGPFATFDNADTYIPWLLDALAQASTGIQVTKKRLYTNNQSVSYVPKCFISLTARTPTFRREDVASRLLIFYLGRIEQKIAEYQLLDEVHSQRDALMSNYAQLLNQVLGASPTQDIDANLRLADFASLSARIGNAFHMDEQMERAMQKVRQSQMAFATEENALYLAMDRWTTESIRLGDEKVNNEGRRILAKDLLQELRQVAEHYSIPFRIKTPNALGMQMRNMADELAIHFEIVSKQTNKGRAYEVRRTQESEEYQSTLDEQ